MRVLRLKASKMASFDQIVPSACLIAALIITCTFPASCLALEEKIIIQPNKLSLKGAMVDNYRTEVLIIKLQTPQDIIKNSLLNVDLTNVPDNLRTKLLLTIGEVEKIAQKRFEFTLSTIVSTLPLTTVVQTDQQEIPKSFIHHSRSKRNPMRLFLSLLRLSRPVARVVPSAVKAGKYARFLKGIKYAGYAASAAAISYEIVDAAGLVPDFRYNELRAAFDEIVHNQQKDLNYYGNLTLLTMKFQEETINNIQNLRTIIVESSSHLEVFIKASMLFNDYLEQLQLSLLMLLNGKLTDFLMSDDTQRAWLESKLPTYLLTYIGTLTPTFDLKFAGYDYKDHNVFISLSVPEPGKQFQLLNFVEWEPLVKIGKECYTSPEPFYYLAYPTTMPQDVHIIEHPLIFDSRSCLNEGFILCEFDALLPAIPDLKFDKYCSEKHGHIRQKRSDSLNDSFNNTKEIQYDITGLITSTLMSLNDTHFRKPTDETQTLTQLSAMISQLDEEKIKRTKMIEDMKKRLDDSEISQRTLKLSFFISIFILMTIFPLYTLVNWWRKRRADRSRTIRQLEQELRTIED